MNTVIATTELLNEADNDKEKYDYELRIDEQWINTIDRENNGRKRL